MENMEKGVNPENDKPKLSGEEEAFKKLLESYDPKALEAYNESGNKEIEVEGVSENPFEQGVRDITASARRKIEEDGELAGMLSQEDKSRVEEIINEAVFAKERNGVWMNTLNMLVKEGGDVEGFKDKAADNLYEEIKSRILEKMGKNETAN